MRSDGSRWKPEGFEDAIEAWLYSDFPDDLLHEAVVNWALDQMTDPYRGMDRDSASPNLWFGTVPGSRRGLTVTTCSYWILEEEHAVRVDIIGAMDSLD